MFLLNFEKNGSVLLINDFLLFKYSEEICIASKRATTLKVVQNDHVPTLFLTRLYLSVKSQRTLGNKRMNDKTIENGLCAKNVCSLTIFYCSNIFRGDLLRYYKTYGLESCTG